MHSLSDPAYSVTHSVTHCVTHSVSFSAPVSNATLVLIEGPH
jgi:hypothetical protein